MNKIIRINMTELKVTTEAVPEAWASLGGRALTSTIVAQEVPPSCHPLGPNNKLVFAPGMLTGTPAANSGRMSLGGKSPLTGTIKESNAGGTAGQQFARLGIKALIIEGFPREDKWYRLHVTADGVTIHEETEMVGLQNFAVIEALEKRYGDKIGIMSIGLPGEKRMRSADISVKDPDHKIRSFGRGGLGAVFGAKRIKCMVIDAAGGAKVPIADMDKFRKAAKTFAKAVLDHPVTGEGLPTYGTNSLLNVLNEAGALPTKNFRFGQYEEKEKICAETMHELIVARNGQARHGCQPGCIIQCSQVYNDADGNYLTSGFEYETVWGLGAHSLIDNLDQIAECDNIMDDIGIDSIEGAVTIGVAMEAGIIPWGDGEGAIRLLREEVGRGTPLGHIIGNGAGSVGEAYGLTRVPVVKNQAIPAYDPRVVKGIGITYATTTMGADHTAGYAVATNVLKVGGFVEPHQKEGQVELSRNLQIATTAVDSTGLCLFVAFPVLDLPEAFPAMTEMISARFGIELDPAGFLELGKEILKLEHAFNLAAGLTSGDDRLPEFFTYDPIPPHNLAWDFTPEEIDAFWDF